MLRRSARWFALAAIVTLGGVGCREEETSGGGGQAGSTSSDGGGGAATGGAGVGGDSSAITLLTWNLEDFPKTVNTIDLVKSSLAELRPDVVALQEINDDGAAWQTLDGTLDDYTGVLATSGDGFLRVGFLYRHDRLIVEGAETLFPSDDYAFPRPMLAAHIASVANPEHDFQLGVVHLKAQLDPESRARRRAACEALDAWVLEVQASGLATDVIIAGDFNDRLTQPPAYNVFGPLLEASDGGFLTLAPEQADEYTYIPFTSFIDHVHVRGDALFATSSAEVIELDDTVASYEDQVSDHRPVLARLEWAD